MIPQKIIVHHSLTKDSGTVSWGAIRRYHIEQRGWLDVGYHAGVELVENNNISYYETLLGRAWDIPGAHTAGQNNNSLGICFVGNFDIDTPPLAQLQAGAKLIKYWMSIFRIPFKEIYPHRKFADKTCPGKQFDMNALIDIIKWTQ